MKERHGVCRLASLNKESGERQPLRSRLRLDSLFNRSGIIAKRFSSEPNQVVVQSGIAFGRTTEFCKRLFWLADLEKEMPQVPARLSIIRRQSDRMLVGGKSALGILHSLARVRKP